MDRAGLLDDAFALSRYVQDCSLFLFSLLPSCLLSLLSILTQYPCFAPPTLSVLMHTPSHTHPHSHRAGQLDTNIAFNLSTYLLQEMEYVPWAAALTWINAFAGRLSLTPIYSQYQVPGEGGRSHVYYYIEMASMSTKNSVVH